MRRDAQGAVRRGLWVAIGASPKPAAGHQRRPQAALTPGASAEAGAHLVAPHAHDANLDQGRRAPYSNPNPKEERHMPMIMGVVSQPHI